MESAKLAQIREWQAELMQWEYKIDANMSLRGKTSLVRNGENDQEVDDGKPILHFLHGNGFASLTYAELLMPLAGEYKIFTQDASGHGLSGVDKRFVGWNKTAERCLQAAQQHLPKSQPKIGFAHSFGGCLTMLMAAQSPDYFDRLIILDPALFPPKMLWLIRGMRFSGLMTQVPMVKQAKRRKDSWPNIESARKYFTGRGTFKGWTDESLSCYLDNSLKVDGAGCSRLVCPPWMESAIFASYPKRLWKSLTELQVPTTIIAGKDTLPFFKQSYAHAAKVNRNIDLLEVEGGHCFMLERPDEIAALVKSLIEQV
ncbi:alpha/beta hydrolase [Marinomonas sp. SBI22]|uniref:alpha/beta fold hydrolase n=1 Tax=unclassified Marinomonas TaxID=196814 RepID=UPI0007AF653A|nr:MULTISPECIES: alpha/beta hydrolase [unclassified Marinomonas]KZM38860.1 alpha/beta hydrolase [Marinomonas sp. SBI22]KZM39482.1 alpha/beta hydrolase [Marinomonas sp. SBI8L]